MIRNSNKRRKITCRVGGTPPKQVSEELGISHVIFIRWVNNALNEGKEAFPGKGYLRSFDAEFIQYAKNWPLRGEKEIS